MRFRVSLVSFWFKTDTLLKCLESAKMHSICLKTR